jgi:hypothetical protein
MSETVTLQIPDELARRARALAAATHRRFEDAVVDWLRRAVEEPAVESLPDDSLLALGDAMLSAVDQDARPARRHREGSLAGEETARLDELMAGYRQGLVLKARAVKEAVARALRPPLADDAA